MTGAAQKVVVAMSGGVDSSTAAALLKEEGFDVVGVTMRLPSYEPGNGALAATPCCGMEGLDDARRVAGKLDIPFYLLDFREEFEQAIIGDFCRAYAEGRTPNPCVRCNEKVKFGELLRRAKGVGAALLATGHYVRKETDERTGRVALHRGKDGADQSYFLYCLSQEQLRHAAFPLGSYTKDQARRFARERGLPVHDKPGSQDLCFLPKGKYREFLRSRCPEAFRPGPVRHVSREVLGQHEGIAAYTVGQRHGLGIAGREPLYVVGVRPAENEVVVGGKEDVLRREMVVGEVNWLSVAPPTGPLSADVKIRDNHPRAAAELTPLDDGNVRVAFRVPQEAPCPGQAAVFYKGDAVLGGGTIESSLCD